MKALKTGWNRGFPGKSVLNITNIVRNTTADGLAERSLAEPLVLIENLNRTTYEQAQPASDFQFCRHLSEQTDAGFAASLQQVHSLQSRLRTAVRDARVAGGR